MYIKILLFTLLHRSVFAGHAYNCSTKSTLMLLRRPIHEFSMKILDRVAQNTDGQFVFSPLSSWIQLAAIAEGATGNTFQEIWKVTKHHRNKCFKRKLAKLLSKMDRQLIHNYRRKSVLVIDELLAVKKSFIKDLSALYRIRVMLKNFAFKEKVAKDVNRFITYQSFNGPKEIIYKEDFETSMMVMTDNIYFKSSWIHPFKTAYTESDQFTGGEGFIGKVNMMYQVGYFHLVDLPMIDARAIELPCHNNISMLVFLPSKNIWIGDLFYDLSRTKLSHIFNTFEYEGLKLVSLKLPRFKINTVVDNLPELYSDMGIRDLFKVKHAQLDKMTKFRGVSPSLMSQSAYIEVTEEGIAVESEFLYKPKHGQTMIGFEANEPFAFLIVDKRTQITLFAGVYSEPTLY